MTDAALVEKTLAGDVQAFGQLVERYRQQVYVLSHCYMRDAEMAHDLAQETFLQAYRKLSQLREPEQFAAWVRVLGSNLCRMALRRAAHATLSLDEIETHPAASDTSAEAERNQLREQVWAAVAALSPRQRLTISLFYFGALSYGEIAAFFGESVAAVESRLHRARRQLHRLLRITLEEEIVSHTLRLPPLENNFADSVLERLAPRRLMLAANHTDDKTYNAIVLHDSRDKEVLVRLTAEAAWQLNTAITGTPAQRPPTHDLILAIFAACGITVEGLVLKDIVRGQSLARLTCRQGRRRETFDAAASDALAIGCRPGTGATIEASTQFLRKARRQKHLPAPESKSTSLPPAAAPEEVPKIVYPRVGLSWAPRSEETARHHARHARRRRTVWSQLHAGKGMAVTVGAVVPDEKGNKVIALRDAKNIHFPFWISERSARVIADLEFGAKEGARLVPTGDDGLGRTIQLLREIMETFKITPLWAAIDSNLESVYYGVLALRHRGVIHDIDARPSDAVAIALSNSLPIFVERGLWRNLGVMVKDGEAVLEAYRNDAEAKRLKHGNAYMALMEPLTVAWRRGKGRHLTIEDRAGVAHFRVGRRAVIPDIDAEVAFETVREVLWRHCNVPTNRRYPVTGEGSIGILKAPEKIEFGTIRLHDVGKEGPIALELLAPPKTSVKK